MSHKNSKLRVLLIAEACNPTWSSVPLVGYNFAHALASRNDLEVTLATSPRNRAAIEADEIRSLADVIYPDNEDVAARIDDLAQRVRGDSGKGWTTNTAFQSFSYLFFERELHKLVAADLEQGKFDIVHRVTPASPTAASPLATWTDIPMIIGPMNGGLPWPEEYPELRKKENDFLLPLRKFYKAMPYYRSTFRNAAAAIGGNSHAISELPRCFHGKRILHPENGIDPRRFELADDWTVPIDRFRFVTVGSLVPDKGLWLTLKAMRNSNLLRDSELVVIGDGPDRPKIEAMIEEYGLASQVHMLGSLDQLRMSRELAQSQCFVFPSLREFNGGVVLEAMASGLPSIVVDYGGPADLLDDQSGILLPMESEETMVSNLQRAMEDLLSDPWRCRGYAQHAIERVREEFTWEAKARELTKLYHDILGTESCQPLQEAVSTRSSNPETLLKQGPRV